jgi:hypothetical protein
MLVDRQRFESTFALLNLKRRHPARQGTCAIARRQGADLFGRTQWLLSLVSIFVVFQAHPWYWR